MLEAVRSGVYYLDAGTGSMLVQLVVAGVAGVAVFAKIWWSKITSPFRRKETVPAAPEGSDPALPERPGEQSGPHA